MRASPLPRTFALSGLALFLLFQTGCITRNLWDKTCFTPATPPNISLYESVSPPGVIVEYNERVGGGRPTGRRAYILPTDDIQPTNGTPTFIPRDSEAAGLKPIPILKVGSRDLVSLKSGYFATVCFDANQFVLYRDGQSLGTIELPFYWKRPKSVSRAALTPLAVVADTAVSVGISAFVFAGSVGGIVP